MYCVSFGANGKPSEAREANRPISSCSSIGRWPKILQEEELARDIGEELYQSALDRNLFEEEIACAAFMSGRQQDERELLAQCHGFQLFTAYAHWVLGFDALAKGDRRRGGRALCGH